MAVAALSLTSPFASAAEVNTASQSELESVKGIGPSLSALILDERRKAAFSDWNDFASRVRGVRGASARRLSDAGLTVNGMPFPGAIGSSASAAASAGS